MMQGQAALRPAQLCDSRVSAQALHTLKTESPLLLQAKGLAHFSGQLNIKLTKRALALTS